MTKENSHNRYRALFFVSLAFIVLFGCVAFYLLYQSQQAQQWNEHRRKMETELGDVLSGIHEMTAATRGYLITGKVQSIVPYKQAYNEVEFHLHQIDSLVKGDKQQSQMMDTLTLLTQERQILLDELIAIHKQSKYVYDSTVSEKINSRILQGDEVMNEIRILVKSMVAYEQYLYTKRVSSGDNFNRQAYILIICFGLITVTVSLYGYLIIQRENDQKQAVELQLNEYYSKVEKVNIMLTEAEKIAKMGSWEWDIKSGKVHWSDGAYKIYNLSSENFLPSYNNFINIIHEEDKENVIKAISEAIEKKRPYEIEFREISSGQNRIVYAVGLARTDSKGNLLSYFGVLGDITQQRTYEKQLEDFNNALKKSNEELEQFAYVASHDLQEPLRKIRSFGDRFMLKYGQETELSGLDYIIKMMDGAERMQILIQDLLSFSRVSRDKGDKVKVDLNQVVKNVLEDLQLSVLESNASILIDHLPKLAAANPIQMHQLFLNLISNAIKFNNENVIPEIKIDCRTVKGSSLHLPDENIPAQKIFYEISIHDNGIGFDEKYLEKIFTIFQRLHGRNEYKGTGIGLAICKKICKNHEGFITARSDGKSGANFLIYLPK